MAGNHYNVEACLSGRHANHRIEPDCPFARRRPLARDPGSARAADTAGEARRSAAHHLSRRDQLRGDRRHRDRRAGQLRPQPDQGRFSGRRGRHAPGCVPVLAGRHSGRQTGRSPVFADDHRAGCQNQSAGIRWTRLRHRARRSEYELRAISAGQSGSQAVHRALSRRERSRRHRSDWRLDEGSPAGRACFGPSTRSWDRS